MGSSQLLLAIGFRRLSPPGFSLTHDLFVSPFIFIFLILNSTVWSFIKMMTVLLVHESSQHLSNFLVEVHEPVVINLFFVNLVEVSNRMFEFYLLKKRAIGQLHVESVDFVAAR